MERKINLPSHPLINSNYRVLRTGVKNGWAQLNGNFGQVSKLTIASEPERCTRCAQPTGRGTQRRPGLQHHPRQAAEPTERGRPGGDRGARPAAAREAAGRPGSWRRLGASRARHAQAPPGRTRPRKRSSQTARPMLPCAQRPGLTCFSRETRTVLTPLMSKLRRFSSDLRSMTRSSVIFLPSACPGATEVTTAPAAAAILGKQRAAEAASGLQGGGGGGGGGSGGGGGGRGSTNFQPGPGRPAAPRYAAHNEPLTTPPAGTTPPRPAAPAQPAAAPG